MQKTKKHTKDSNNISCAFRYYPYSNTLRGGGQYLDIFPHSTPPAIGNHRLPLRRNPTLSTPRVLPSGSTCWPNLNGIGLAGGRGRSVMLSGTPGGVGGAGGGVERPDRPLKSRYLGSFVHLRFRPIAPIQHSPPADT